jgi:Acetyltransferase (GNAT) domain
LQILLENTLEMDSKQFLPLNTSHRASVESLFTTCFGKQPEAKWYEWKYASNPRFDGLAMGLFDGGRLIAHYAGFPRVLMLPMSTSTAEVIKVGSLQIGDVMVDPVARHGIARNNQFSKLTRNFFSHALSSSCPIAFGFPNQRHLRQGIIAGLYTSIGNVHEVEWTLEGTRSLSMHTCELACHSNECHPESIDQLHFDRIANTVAFNRGRWAVVSRSLEYWQWRFPVSKGYRWIKSSHGFAIIRREDRQGYEWHLVDWLCEPGDAESLLGACIKLIIGYSLLEMKMSDRFQIRLKCWASVACVEELSQVPKPQVNGLRIEFLRRITNVELALNRFPAQAYEDIVRDRLWVISGDTDFL